jgi:imidazolonepropionase-like amidohydrolase
VTRVLPRSARALALIAGAALRLSAPVAAQQPEPDLRPAPARGEGEGPFDRLIIRGAILIDGAGGPPRGPVDIVVERNRIKEIRDVGAPHLPIDPKRRPQNASREIDAAGMYVLPGFVDLHLHTGSRPWVADAEYTYKLWMAHGITAGRGVPFGPLEWALREKARANRNEITAPRMFSYHVPGSEGEGWKDRPIVTPDDAREWVRWAAGRGIDGLKLGASPPDIMKALLDEARQHGLGSTAHLQQLGVARMNALDAVKLGLGTVTHFYGLFEAMYESNDIQPWPAEYNYNDEQWRFGQVAQQARLVKPKGEKWNELLKDLLAHRAVLDPTMTAYLASRDVMARRNADYHDKYTLPSLWDFFTPSRANHGSYYFNWTTWEEVAWKRFYQVWMEFLNDYKNLGGRVTASSDAGFIYNLYGFGTIAEMELLQEAGFHPLEVIRGATLHAAEALHEPTGAAIEFGAVRPGYLADLVVVPENPLANLKVLYGTGAVRLNDQTGKPERIGGIRWTIKDGIVYDARRLLADVARMVERQKAERKITSLPPVAPATKP